MKKSIFSFTLNELREYLVTKGFAKFAADQIYLWIYKQFEFDMTEWTNVSKKIKAHFAEHLDFTLPLVHFHIRSVDGTRKFLLKLRDGEIIETVSIPANGRLTQCISSQVGCAIGCTFCNTGTMGLTRNLGSDEIIGQYLAVTKWLHENGEADTRISNIVYMGQGEPLHNYDNVLNATNIFMEDKGLGLGGRKITLSTSGLVPQIEKLNEFPSVNIAISLHSPNNKTRTELMPINKTYDLERLFGALKKLKLKEHRYITYEYLLIADLNDQESDIEGLSKLLDTKSSKINLIPYNEFESSPYKRPTDLQINWFKNQLIRRGYICTTRASKGSDIMAACGQLKSEKENN